MTQTFFVHVEHPEPHARERGFVVRGPEGTERRYRLPGVQHADYLDFWEQAARDFGLHPPLARSAEPHRPGDVPLEPLLTEAVDPRILYGYGDPSVIRVAEDGGYAWYLVATSNDAPDAFPILRSTDLKDWRLTGFVFPRGRTPAWALTGENVADYWAPEMHKVGDSYWVCFAARGQDHELSIGLAFAPTPQGPFETPDEPLVTGRVIDAHILLGPDGSPHLLWKVDDNGVWPRLLAEALLERRQLIPRLFADPADQRAASLAAALWPWAATLEPMEQFFILQPMIEGATRDFTRFREALIGLEAQGDPALQQQLAAIVQATRTRIFAQRLAPDGRSLLGEPTLVLENDLVWEAHLIEGAWAVEHAGRYYLFYAGNDFSTPHYGIGAAVADSPLGPYRKLQEPLLRSTDAWWGPGHPSVALGPDGRHRMFLHAFFPGRAGYKAFRAMLATPVAFDGEHIRLGGR